MLDNQILEVLFPLISQGLEDLGYEGVVCQSSYQPTRQGVVSDPSVYIFKIGTDVPYGMPTRQDKWDPIGLKMYEIFIQTYISTFQFSARVLQDVSNINYTASDLVNMTRLVLLQSSTIDNLKANGISILKPGQTTNPYFLDDKNQFEGAPTFDVEFNHDQRVDTQENSTRKISKVILGV